MYKLNYLKTKRKNITSACCQSWKLYQTNWRFLDFFNSKVFQHLMEKTTKFRKKTTPFIKCYWIMH